MKDNPEELKEVPDVVRRIKDEKRKFEARYEPWRKEAKENYDMVAGDGRQWDAETRAKLEAEGRPCVEFDRLGTIIDAVSGSEINNRQETIYIPRVPGDVQKQGVGSLRTASARWVRDNCDAEDEESDSFVDVLITGVGCTHTRMDYEEDEEGQIFIERKDVLRMGWDASARKRNNADAKCVWEECKYTKEEVEEKWPDKAEEIQFASDISTEDEDEDIKVVDPRTAYDKNDQQVAARGQVDVTHFQWFDVQTIYKVADPVSQGVVELDEERFQAALQSDPALKYAKTPRRVYMEAFVCGNVELEVAPLCDGATSPAKDFSFQFITGKRDRNRGYWYGLVRPGKDPQRWANKFFSQILHIINTNAKGGVLIEEGAVKNVRKFEENWAKSDAVQTLNPGGLNRIQPKQPAQIPNSLFQTMEFAISSIRDCTGVNLELLGLADRQQAGVLENQRTQAGLTILAPFFASLRLYRKRHGRLLAYYIKEYISDGRLIRVAGAEGEQFVNLLREPVDIDYDVVVDSAPTARDTKEKTWATMGPVLQMFMGQGIKPPPEVLDYLPVPNSLAQLMKQAYIEHGKQPNPMQDAQLAQIAADTELAEAGAAEKYMKAGTAGIGMLAQLMGPQQPGMLAAPTDQGALSGIQAPQPQQPGMKSQPPKMDPMAQVMEQQQGMMAMLAQAIQGIGQGLSQLAQSQQMLAASLTAPKVNEAVRDPVSGRITHSIQRTQLQ